ncbi:hypothetical protein LTR36_001109 [Oleoguttula mirabilis]|uniref:Deacetylase sirtuin-type domain-containing protein n=1 Tax=Oleoguttula mirabilis TaxID=1507867 RepID=A0AAV9JSF5_9PEZI|nr:hypothetical protein LTR36_001109 [Oleoguttula mirabilis]
MADPISGPTLLTPRAQLKRKHSEIVDLTNDDEDAAPGPSATPANDAVSHGQHRRLEDDEVGGDDGSVFEDALDEIELNPYVPTEGDDEALSENVAAQMRAQLRENGPEEFIRKYLSNRVIPLKLLGTAFGIDPNLDLPKEVHLRILGLAILRAYHKRQKLTQYNTIDDAVDLLRKSHNIMVITGAGISTSLGIPDFRSKGTGFYDKVRGLGYETGEEVFDIDNFDGNPNIFYNLAGDILPDQQRFSPTHGFLRLLQDKSRLQTNYTQNIDNLERLAGIDEERLIQCHGSFATASCRKCHNEVPGEDIFGDIRAKRVARCKLCAENLAKQPMKKQKAFKLRKNDWEDSSDDDSAYDVPEAGVMKPDITFFGEQLPNNFFERFTDRDAKTVDLVVVIGTSLKVAPVSEMPNHLPHNVPHIFISREPIKHVTFDIQLLGDCDHVVYELCRRAGWALKHEMIPPNFRAKVRAVEGSDCMWTVRPKKPKADASTPHGERRLEATPRRQENGIDAARRHRETMVDVTPQQHKSKVLTPASKQKDMADTASQKGTGTVFTALYKPH